MSTQTTTTQAASGGVTLNDLHAANKARQTEWCTGGDPEPDLAFRGNELAGETGEACNVIKKLERERYGWRGSRATLDDLAQELADVIICTDLCAITAGIDLAAAVVAKFNATSEKQGLATKLAAASQAAPVTGTEGDKPYDTEFAGDRLSRLKRAWSNHETPDEADHVWLLRMATKGVDALAPATAPQPAGAERVDLVSYLERQWAWSKETFGPALRTKGIVQHITKELREIEAEPHDLAEWVDVIILAMDGFWRHGSKPEDLLPAMQAKQDRNFARTWPDWRTMGEDQAIEHDRTEEKRLAALVAAKAAEPVFQELAARLDAGINWPRYLPVIKEGPTGVSAWQVILPGGRLINLSDEEWQAAVDLGGPPRPAPCDGSGEAGETHSGSTEGDSAVTEGQAPHPQSPSVSEVEAAKAVLELADSFEQSGKTLFHPEQYAPGYLQAWEEAHRYCARDLRTLVASWRRP